MKAGEACLSGFSISSEQSACSRALLKPIRIFRFCLLITSLCLGAGLLFGLALKLAPRLPLLGGVPFSTLVLAQDGSPLRLSLAEDEKYRIRARLSDLNPDLIRATLLYEDRYFYSHPGVNPLSLARALASCLTSRLAGTRRMGGSTLTMQVARLRFDLKTDTVSGKLRQMLIALRLETHYSKRELLEAYFNLAPYGGNVEGAQAAARIYFHVPAARLTLSECLALAVTPQNPGRRNPLGNADGRTHLIAARGRLAAMWEKTYGATVARELLTAPLRAYSPSDLPFAAPHVTSLLLARSASGEVRTTLAPRAQEAVEAAIRRFADRGRPYGIHNAAALLLHWPDMEIRALAGSADFHSQAIQGQVDASRARRSPGSTLKPFIYALALDQELIHPMTLLMDAPRGFRDYNPENFDQHFRGPIPAKDALAASRNIPAISLAARLRYPDLYSFLQRAGVRFPFSQEHYGLSLVLGGAEVTMLEMAGLYAMLPNRGLWRPLRLTAEQESPPQRLLSPEAAFITLDMLRDSDLRLQSSGARLPVHLKTGTSNGFRDAWTAGVFGPYVLVVWVGNFDNSPNPLFIGRDLAVPLFTDIAHSLAAREPLRDLCTTPAPGLNLVELPVCSATGDTDTSLCEGSAIPTWFIPGTSPIAGSGILRRILIDKASGLRACVDDPETTNQVIWEFWPSDMRRIFRLAGVDKPLPPDWMPGCGAAGAGGTGGASRHDAGRDRPQILTPREGVTYQLRLSDTRRNTLPLTAITPADARVLFWFVNGVYIGQTTPEAELLWTPPPGSSELRVVDDKGRSDRVKLKVESVE